MSRIFLSIASIPICIEAPYKISYDESVQPFISNSGLNPRYTYKVEVKENIDYGTEICRREEIKICRKKSCEYRIWFGYYANRKYEFVLEQDLKLEKNNLYITKDFTRHIPLFSNMKVLAHLGLERIFLKEKAMLLHSSFICYKGEAILFSAPSGIGKSTQAELWQKFKRAEIINGDRTLIKQEKGRYAAYGSPFAGTSHIYVNKSAPIRGVVLLLQSPENRIEVSEEKDSFSALLKEILVNSWNSGYMCQIMELLDDFIQTVPIYRLSCRPDIGAVELVEQTLFG